MLCFTTMSFEPVACDDEYIITTPFHTPDKHGNILTVNSLSCVHIVGTDVLHYADLILGKAKWTGEIDGGVLSQTDNT